MWRIVSITILILGVAASTAAQTQKLLLPIVISRPTRGAFGSVWATNITVLNTGSIGVGIEDLTPPCGMDPCTKAPLPPSRTLTVNPVQGEFAGKFVHVPDEAVADLKIRVRVLDLSRLDINNGTEIPVVQEPSAVTRALQLLDVPVGAEFRSLVRIYDFYPGRNHGARVRVFEPHDGLTDDTLLSETFVPLRVPVSPEAYPGYAEVTINTMSGVPPSGTVRVEVAPLTEGLRFWAFASITNNVTQHVTIVSP